MLQGAGIIWTTTPRPRIGHTRWRVKDCLLGGTVLIIQNMERTMSSEYICFTQF
jgi:hypothetical protein